MKSFMNQNQNRIEEDLLSFCKVLMTTNPYIGSSLDDLLEEDGILDEVEAIALKQVLAWQVSQAMQEKGHT
jgi:hypothetical protein